MAPGSVRSSSSTPSRSKRRTGTPPTRSKQNGVVGQASWISSNINLVNTILGAGLLAMPLAMSHLGMFFGVIVVVWSGLTAGFGLYLQCRCAAYLERGSASFFALSQITYPNAAVIFDAAIAIKCFGVGVSYLIIIGDLMPGVVLGFISKDNIVPFMIDRHFWITAFMLVVIPLSFLRRLDSLKYTSVIALMSISYLVVLVVYHFAAGDTIDHYTSPIRKFYWAGPVAALSSFPVIVFAYTCHQNMFSILNEINDNSHLSTLSVIVTSIGGAASMYILVGITGYLSFGNDVGGNIVAQYKSSVSATIGRAAIVVLVMFSYPLQVHPCRASVDAVLRWSPRSLFRQRRSSHGSHTSGRDADPSSPLRETPLLSSPRNHHQKPKTEISETRFAAITTIIIILSYFVAMTVSSLEAVLAYVGSTGSTSISFILPGLFYHKISSPDSPAHQRLIKAEDDFDNDVDSADEPTDSLSQSRTGRESNDTEDVPAEAETETGGLLSSLTSSGTALLHRTRHSRRIWLRRLSLALAIYGLCVMIVCLIVNTFFVIAH